MPRAHSRWPVRHPHRPAAGPVARHGRPEAHRAGAEQPAVERGAAREGGHVASSASDDGAGFRPTGSLTPSTSAPARPQVPGSSSPSARDSSRHTSDASAPRAPGRDGARASRSPSRLLGRPRSESRRRPPGREGGEDPPRHRRDRASCSGSRNSPTCRSSSSGYGRDETIAKPSDAADRFLRVTRMLRTSHCTDMPDPRGRSRPARKRVRQTDGSRGDRRTRECG